MNPAPVGIFDSGLGGLTVAGAIYHALPNESTVYFGGACAAVRAAPGAPIGVIGTAGTVASGAYVRAIQRLTPDPVVVQQACPLFVPLVEEGWFEHPATRLVAQEYLAPLRRAGVRSLVLGCTHYPLLAPLLADLLGAEVSLVDSAAETASVLASLLGARGGAARRLNQSKDSSAIDSSVTIA